MKLISILTTISMIQDKPQKPSELNQIKNHLSKRLVQWKSETPMSKLFKGSLITIQIWLMILLTIIVVEKVHIASSHHGQKKIDWIPLNQKVKYRVAVMMIHNYGFRTPRISLALLRQEKKALSDDFHFIVINQTCLLPQ